MDSYTDLINSSDVVLVEFFATWCPHCNRMMPIVEEVKELTEGKAQIFQFDIDENQKLAEENDVETVPTFLLYKNGNLEWRYSGEMPGEELYNRIQSLY